MTQISAAARAIGWRTPAVIIVCGCLISLIGFGPRSSFGFFLTPMSAANGWGRDVFALAFALQNLLWGIGQPFAGAVADRFGMVRVLSVGALLYAAGLALMAYTTSPVTLQVTAGVLIGFGLSGCSFNLVIAAFGKLLRRALPHARDRRRHGGRLVRPVPVRAVRRRADRQRRLAAGAAGVRRPAAADRSDGARARDAALRAEAGRRPRRRRRRSR